MAVIEALTEDECYLWAILTDDSGIDQAEFSVVDEVNDDACFRAWPFQWPWFRCDDMFQVDQGSRSSGKALDCSTPILTTAGWKTMETVLVGDFVFNEEGKQVQVTKCFDIMYDRDCFEVVFSDGSTIVADGDHQWMTETYAASAKRRKNNSPLALSIKTTKEIKETLFVHSVKPMANHRIGVTKPLEYEKTSLPIDPYILGFWLGDGTRGTAEVSIGNQDALDSISNLLESGFVAKKLSGKYKYSLRYLDETEWEELTPGRVLTNRNYGGLSDYEVNLVRNLHKNGWSLDELAKKFDITKSSLSGYVRGKFRRSAGGPVRSSVHGRLKSELQAIGVLYEKFIPEQYKTACVDDRIALVQGLMDTDGHISNGGYCEITLSSKRLIDDLLEILLGLGQKATIHEKTATCNDYTSTVWRINFTPNNLIPFRLNRKVARVKQLSKPSIVNQRRIVNVRPVESRPVRCISVDGDSHLYLAGRTLIPTHNSLSVKLRTFAFPFCHPGQEMVITAPEGIHLLALISNIENIFYQTRLANEMLIKNTRQQIKHKPFQVLFQNGAHIEGRIPQRDGKGMKGAHPIVLELDEGQDYPEPAWNEVIETLKKGSGKERWRIHGVTRGVRDKFYEFTQPDSGWTVHWLPAMYRPTWTEEEREAKTKQYGHRDNPDFRRNIYGLHGDSSSPIFVLSRLMNCGIGSTLVTIVDEEGLSFKTLDAVKIGEKVLNAAGTGSIENIILSEHNRLVKISHGGEDLFFSEDHPFFTSNGWVFAKDLKNGDYLATDKTVQSLWTNFYSAKGWEESEVLQQRMLETSNSKAKKNMSDLFNFFFWDKPQSDMLNALCWNSTEKEQSKEDTKLQNLWERHSERQGYVPVLQPEVLAYLARTEDASTGVSKLPPGVFGKERAEILFESLCREISWKVSERKRISSANSKKMSRMRRFLLSSLKRDKVLFDELFSQESFQKQNSYYKDMFGMSNRIYSRQTNKKVLLSSLLERFQKICSKNTDNEKMQSGKRRVKSSAVRFMDSAGRKRSWLASRVLDKSDGRTWRRLRFLSNRFSSIREKNSNRSRWLGTLNGKSETEGRNQGFLVGFSRVDSVEVLEQGSKEFTHLSQGKDTITLYDLTVTSHPSFYVGKNRVLVHNCTDKDLSSDFNSIEYFTATIESETVEDVGGDILSLIDIPASHLKYRNFWIGMDVGYVQHPSAIVVFAEEKPPKGETRLKLLTRIQLKKITHKHQVAVILHLMDLYRPIAFACDRTGLGLPLFQDIQEKAQLNPNLAPLVDRIKGYNFSEKIVVEIDDSVKIDPHDPDAYKKAEIKRNVLEFSTDCLRGLVDEKRILLPWDRDLIAEFQGQTFSFNKSLLDMYGRKRSFSQGSFHTLDACRMAVLAFKQNAIEQFIKNQEKPWIPPPSIFLD